MEKISFTMYVAERNGKRIEPSLVIKAIQEGTIIVNDVVDALLLSSYIISAIYYDNKSMDKKE